MGTGRVQAHGTPCPGSFSQEASAEPSCPLHPAVTQGPLLLQLWKGKSSLFEGQEWL